jgi:hypothetical protein
MAKKANNYGFIPDDSAELPAPPPEGSHNYGFVADPEQPIDENNGIIGTAIKGLQAAGKGLDYARGATGGPLMASAIEKVSGKKVVKPDEYANAAKLNNLSTYPKTDTMLERAGVPSGPSLADATKWLPGVGGPLIQKGDPMDITARGAAGFVGDAVSDPLTYLSFGANKVAKMLPEEGGMLRNLFNMPGVKQATAVANAPSAATSNIGKKLFSWGIQPIEQAGERFGKNEVADTMYKYGIKGTGGQIEERLGQTAKKLKDARDGILSEADAAGATVPRDEAFKSFQDNLSKMVEDRRISPEEADALHKSAIGTFMTGEDPSTSLASQWKTDMYKSLPQKAYDVTKNPNVGQSLNKQASNGLKTAVENTVEGTTGRGKELAKTNGELGQLLSVMPATSKYADMLERQPILSQWDMAAGFGGGLMSDNPAKGASLLAAKKLLQIGKMPVVRTNVGSALRTIGEGATAPYLDTLVRQGTSRALRKAPKNGEND